MFWQRKQRDINSHGIDLFFPEYSGALKALVILNKLVGLGIR